MKQVSLKVKTEEFQTQKILKSIGIAIQGWGYTYTTCMGIEHAEDQFADGGEATMETSMRLRGIMEGEQQCPICGKE